MLADLIQHAKSWRGLARFVVHVIHGEATEEVTVKLGDARRRWKRVEQTLEPLADDIVGARGFDDSGELIGAWDAPDEQAEEESPDRIVESDAMAAHRAHTQWCFREAAKMHVESMRLVAELVGVVLDVVKSIRGAVTTAQGAPANEDEATKTLAMLLSMAAQQRSDDESQRDERRQNRDATVQGQPSEPAQAGAAP